MKKLDTNRYLTTYSREYQGRMRKYYSLTEIGEEQLFVLREEWILYTDTINGIIEGSVRHDKNWIFESAWSLSDEASSSWSHRAMDYFKELFDDAGPEGEES